MQVERPSVSKKIDFPIVAFAWKPAEELWTAQLQRPEDRIVAQRFRLEVAANRGKPAPRKLLNFLNGSVDLAYPLISQTQTRAHDPLLSFRVFADF